jgi:hypothetical protein
MNNTISPFSVRHFINVRLSLLVTNVILTFTNRVVFPGTLLISLTISTYRVLFPNQIAISRQDINQKAMILKTNELNKF